MQPSWGLGCDPAVVTTIPPDTLLHAESTVDVAFGDDGDSAPRLAGSYASAW